MFLFQFFKRKEYRKFQKVKKEGKTAVKNLNRGQNFQKIFQKLKEKLNNSASHYSLDARKMAKKTSMYHSSAHLDTSCGLASCETVSVLPPVMALAAASPRPLPQVKNRLPPSLRVFRWPGTNFVFWLDGLQPPPLAPVPPALRKIRICMSIMNPKEHHNT